MRNHRTYVLWKPLFRHHALRPSAHTPGSAGSHWVSLPRKFSCQAELQLRASQPLTTNGSSPCTELGSLLPLGLRLQTAPLAGWNEVANPPLTSGVMHRPAARGRKRLTLSGRDRPGSLSLLSPAPRCPYSYGILLPRALGQTRKKFVYLPDGYHREHGPVWKKKKGERFQAQEDHSIISHGSGKT